MQCLIKCCISDDAIDSPQTSTSFVGHPDQVLFNEAIYAASQTMLAFQPPFPYQIVRKWVSPDIRFLGRPQHPLCAPGYKIVPYSKRCETIHKMQAALQRYGVGGFKEHAFLDWGRPSPEALKELFQEVITQNSSWNQEVDLIRADLKANEATHKQTAKLHRDFITFVDSNLTPLVRQALSDQGALQAKS